jgi:hypothetical protein
MSLRLSDALLFETPDRDSALSLSRRLQPRWVEAVGERDGMWRVAVLLRPIRGDLATLLREVETWSAERELEELWFQLDGRSYLMRVADPAATAA